MKRVWPRLLLVAAMLVLFVGVLAWKGLKLGIDLRGGSELIYKIDTSGLNPAEINNMVEIIHGRIDPQGTKEIRIERLGSDRIRIQLTETSEESRDHVKRVIEQLGKLELK